MVSAPNSPVKSVDKENLFTHVHQKNAASRRHSLAPSKSILKNTSLGALNESDTNHTVAIMQKLPSKENRIQPLIVPNRRVSFAPEVTLHKIDMIPQFFEPSPKRQPRRRDTLQFVPPIRTDEDEFEDPVDEGSSDMDVDESSAPLNKSPFVIYEDENVESDEEEFDSLFEEAPDGMEITTHHGNLKVDEIDILKISSPQEADDIEAQEAEPAGEEEDMEITVYQAAGPKAGKEMSISHIMNQTDQEMDLTMYHRTAASSHDTELQENSEPSSKEQTQNEATMQLTAHQGKIIGNQDEMDITNYHGEGALMHIEPLAQSTQSQQESQALSAASKKGKGEVIEQRKNPQLERIQKQESNFSFDSSQLEEHESTVEPTITAFGDPSIFETILRVTGGSQDSEEDGCKENQILLPTPAKRGFSTPKKSLTTDAGSPQERSSSLKKRKLSFSADGDSTKPADESQSPIAPEISVVEAQRSLILAEDEVPLTPLKDSLLLSSPEPQQDIQQLIESLTPNRTKKRESFGYTSQSPRRRSISEEVALTPLRVAKNVNDGALNLSQAVVTTTVPLAGNDDSQDMEDITDDYIPADLQTFLRSAGVKFYDDLNVRDNSNDAVFSSFDPETLNLEDYLIGLAKLKKYELANFSCNELRKNIDEGKQLFATLEREIMEENPPLIREYFEADSQVQTNMNLQFQVLKNYARQQAKNVWYGWRAKLVEGVHQNLMIRQRSLEDSKLKIEVKTEELTKEHSRLVSELQVIQSKLGKLIKHKQEFESCDKDELLALRAKLIATSQECSAQQQQLRTLNHEAIELQKTLNKSSDSLIQAQSEIDAVKAEIKENQMYSMADIKFMQTKFTILERIGGLQLKKYEQDSIEMKVDNVEITLNVSASNFVINFGPVDSPILKKFQPMLLDEESDHHSANLTKLLERLKTLNNVNQKVEKLRLLSNDPVRLMEASDSIKVTVKEVHSSFKRLTSFNIDLKVALGEQMNDEALITETVLYGNSITEIEDKASNNAQLKALLVQVGLM